MRPLSAIPPGMPAREASGAGEPPLRAAGRTDPGRVRRNNEDVCYVDRARGIFLVVDGIGGHAAGEKAAAIAVEVIKGRLSRATSAAELRIREAIALANNAILDAAQASPEFEGMACVLTLAVIENGGAYYGHVGDSRLYRLRRGEKILKVTKDHSPVGEREDAEEIGEAEAMRHPRRNEVFRDVGSERREPGDANFIDSGRVEFDAETALLLCSDGLTDQVPAAEVQTILERHAGNPDAAAQALIEAANAAGGKDNVTAVVVEGERFAAPAGASAPKSTRAKRWLIAAAALFNLAFAAAVLYALYKPKPPVVIEPRTLTAGPGAAYSTIAAALKAARNGDTVEALGGEYREHVFLKSGVTLRSRIPREARLVASPLDNTAVTAIAIDHARFGGFLIEADAQNPLANGILLQNSSVEIENVEIEGAATGIWISGPRAPTLTGNALRDCSQAGIVIEGLVDPWILHNTFQRDKTAIAIRGEAKPALSGNVFDKAPLDLPKDLTGPVRDHNFLLDFRPPARAFITKSGGKRP